MEQQLALYEATRTRLRARLVELRAEQRRVNWVGLALLVVTGISRAFGFGVMVFVGLMSLSLFVVAHYVVYMHIQDSHLTLRTLRENIDKLNRSSRPAGANPPSPR